MDPYRNQRISEGIREELEELISYELSDPRIGGVSVTEVHVAPDVRRAHVRLALRGSREQQQQTLDALNSAKGFLKNQLAERLQLFRMPDLLFGADLEAGLAAKAPQVLKRIRRGRPRDTQE